LSASRIAASVGFSGELVLHPGPQARRDDALVGDDQRTANAEEFQLGVEQVQRAEVELDAGEVGDQSHVSPLC
jgi:hypothetical protein